MPFVGIGVGRQRFPESEGGFDADYQAVLDYATTQGYTLPSSGQQTLQNQLVVDLKEAGIWSKLDTFGVFATDGDSDFALIDWIRLTDYTAVNSPTFTTNQGFQGDGTSAYIDTNYNAISDGINYTLNNASFGYYMKQYDSFPTSSEACFSAFDLTNRAWVRYTSKILYMNSSGTAYTNFTAQSNQFVGANRTSSGNINLYSNGNLQDTLTDSSVTLPIANFMVMKRSSVFSDSQVSMVYVGADLSSEQSDFYTAFYTNYLSNL